ncbi:MAG: hypothetical protein JW929_03860 [Anaerolineales bacterium]|nr:hypothetical protein [Anaerolineales bacterium]
MTAEFSPHGARRAAALLAAGFLLLACSLPLSLPAGLGGGSAEESGDADGAPASGGGEGQADAPEDYPPLPLTCPSDYTTASLTFNHDIKFGVEGMGRFGVTVSGTYKINIIHSISYTQGGERHGVSNIDTGPLTVRLTAEDFENCEKGTGTTSMHADVSGNCLDDTLTLIIKEYYEEGQVTMLCGEGDDKEEVPIPLPLKPLEEPRTITVSYSQLAAKGSANKFFPFSGMGGSGGWNYILIL